MKKTLINFVLLFVIAAVLCGCQMQNSISASAGVPAVGHEDAGSGAERSVARHVAPAAPAA